MSSLSKRIWRNYRTVPDKGFIAENGGPIIASVCSLAVK
jgi:hypothetical protein